MLEWQLGGLQFRLSLLFPALVTALLVWQPEGLAISCMVASLIHEGGHLLAMLLFGVLPRRCIFGAFGMRIEIGDALTSYGRNLMVAMAGPLANGLAAVSLLLLACPSAAMVHLVLAGLNLLPAANLDGGEILRCGLCLLGFDELAEVMLRRSSALMLVLLMMIGVWFYLLNKNITLFIVSCYLMALIFLQKNEKTS